MRLAFILDEFPALSETFIVNQVAGLIDRGVTPDIFALHRGNTQQRHADVDRYDMLGKVTYAPVLPQGKFSRITSGIRHFPRLFWQNPTAAINAVNPIKYGAYAKSMRLLHHAAPFFTNRQYDIIHCNFGNLGHMMARLRTLGLMPGKLVVQFYGFDVSALPKIQPTGYYDELFAQASCLMVLSNYMKSRLVKLGCPEEKIVIHRTGADERKFTFKPRTLQPGEPIRIVSLARLAEKKGLEYAIQAIAQVVDKRQDFIFDIIGDGPLRQPLEEQINRLGVGEYVHLLGWQTQEQIQQHLDQSHILMAPSVTAQNGDQEGTPTAIVEAQMMGLPVLSTVHSGIPDMVEHGVNGYLVPERDVDALAEHLLKLMNQPEDWPQMGQHGSNHARRLFDVNLLNDQLIEIYQNVLQQS
ncbi:MAG TPA: colanic acid biosynthesis glycosyltransferase WcaL [Phycisphaerales bacterium]|nr:colanic acid biosynthesis glycosyltransferase WcaL [Phycisphaerales bacterium]HCD33825.1 colanic acid biosynthesis glycosyltransferase WcaL [Phycisphaerales bacterium]|tara:strand:+ start:1935 stop:3170 length:1236 start_codon:yes stop_codon:yes gene_type:complete